MVSIGMVIAAARAISATPAKRDSFCGRRCDLVMIARSGRMLSPFDCKSYTLILPGCGRRILIVIVAWRDTNEVDME